MIFREEKKILIIKCTNRYNFVQQFQAKPGNPASNL